MGGAAGVVCLKWQEKGIRLLIKRQFHAIETE